MPNIRNGERRSQYIPRCLAYVMKNEGLSKDAALGKCEGMFDQHEKKNKHNAKADLISKIADKLGTIDMVQQDDVESSLKDRKEKIDVRKKKADANKDPSDGFDPRKNGPSDSPTDEEI